MAENIEMVLSPQDVDLAAKDQVGLKCAWIVQINSVVDFWAKIYFYQVTIMGSVNSDVLHEWILFRSEASYLKLPSHFNFNGYVLF